MTIHPKTRDLARCLLTYEAATGKSSETMMSATLRVYEKLRQCLGAFAGLSAFAALASRALALAKPEAPSLSTAQITADGSMRGLGACKPRLDDEMNQVGENQSDEHEVLLIAWTLGLLLVFLGESLTLSLLKAEWPSDVFDDFSLGNGRKT
jgi:hypothetical protein